MDGGQNKTPAREQARYGNRDAEAAGPCSATPYNFTWIQPRQRAERQLYLIHPEGGDEPFTIEAKGRDAWTLDRLSEAGARGCTPITQPAPRWSAYVHNLRGLGVPIETVREPHRGDFPGTHARYVLRASVTPAP